MKCPQCDGYGKVTYIVRSGNRIISKEVGECDYCYGTGEVNDWETESTEEPMTNEEWIKSLDTEQLAEWIASVVKKAISIKENNDIVMLESAVWWDEWLKQPHREENEK